MRVLCIGEPLVEFTSRPDAPSTFQRRAGGDTLNTAIYLSRLTARGTAAYLSALGDDPQSLWLRDQMKAEGVDCTPMMIQPGSRPGLSFIATNAAGERSFTYWREQSPFRGMFSNPERLSALDGAEMLFLSAITLAVLLPDGRDALLDALKRRRAEGADVVFDTNYRAALWPDAATARQVIGRAVSIASLVLPSLDDMTDCFGCAEPATAIATLRGFGQPEIILTTGGDTVLRCPAGTDTVHRHGLPPPVAALDTTGAGDSFNAALLAARLAGQPIDHAINAAARLAAIVVTHPGAIIPAAAMPISESTGDLDEP